MKNYNYLLTIIAFTILLGLVACNQKTAIPVPTDTTTLITTATPLPAPTPGDYERQVTVDGMARSYLLHIPPGINGLHIVPVVFAFHGMLSGPIEIKATTGLNDIADQASFIAVYPRGTGTNGGALFWNAGLCCGFASTKNMDEITFVQQILVDLKTIIVIDTKRIYATGFSNGAMLSYRLACEMSDTFAAIAPVSGVLVYSPCQPQQPVSVMHVHGLRDEVLPYAGGGLLIPGGSPSVEEGIATWVQLDGCTGSPKVEIQKNIWIITHTVYDTCKAATAIELYTLDSLTHDWVFSNVMPLTKIIWEFFAAHPKL
jgi:polyhydroxybutyrate depolymerase